MSSARNEPWQVPLPLVDPAKSVRHFANKSSEERGAIYTRSEVVNFILDLSGYTADRPLYDYRLLEPSFGAGDFLIPTVQRLLISFQSQVLDKSSIVDRLRHAIQAIEIHPDAYNETRVKVRKLLQKNGVSEQDAHALVDSWFVEGDFLLAAPPHLFTHAVGNPPYIRQEHIPDELIAEYKARYNTFCDRADMYVPFIEKCLSLLEPGGILGFICSDRWMKNKYGASLRKKVSEEYRLVYYVDMSGMLAFKSNVAAYTAVTVIKKEKTGASRLLHRPPVNKESLASAAAELKRNKISKNGGVFEVDGIAKGSAPWILKSFDKLKIARRLEAMFPLLEQADCKVGIGVATGADKIFIGPYDGLDVETDRKLPLVGTKDVKNGFVEWKGLGVINPFNRDGSLVDLPAYPKLSEYMDKHSELIRRRNCAKKNPKAWYRTIDRIYPDLVHQPKLLIPDIKGEANIVYEKGRFYPHHNLYYILSEQWDMKALQAVLLSGIAELFVSLYSVRMRGDYLRFQAQYLRRIRLPRWQDIDDGLRRNLLDSVKTGNVTESNQLSYDIYQLTSDERSILNFRQG